MARHHEQDRWQSDRSRDEFGGRERDWGSRGGYEDGGRGQYATDRDRDDDYGRGRWGRADSGYGGDYGRGESYRGDYGSRGDYGRGEFGRGDYGNRGDFGDRGDYGSRWGQGGSAWGGGRGQESGAWGQRGGRGQDFGSSWTGGQSGGRYGQESGRGWNAGEGGQEWSGGLSQMGGQYGQSQPAHSQYSRSQSTARRGPHVGKGPKGYRRSDERIREEVSDALERDPDIDASEIEVEVRDGEVLLKGTVDAREAKRAAEDLAEAVHGVKDVRNELRVSRSGSFSGNGSPATSRSTTTQVSARDEQTRGDRGAGRSSQSGARGR